MGMHSGQQMAEHGAMMWGMGPGMLFFGLLYILVIVMFLWLLYRGVIALEEIAENTDE